MLQNVNMDRSERTTAGETLLGEQIGEITGIMGNHWHHYWSEFWM